MTVLSIIVLIALLGVPAGLALRYGVDSRVDDGRPNL
jgi:hypothetical protein